MKSPPLNALYVFEAFARRGRMTAAADELCITHGAVSRQIRQLETRLGFALIQGPKNKLILTEAGLKLADQLTTAFRIVETALPSRNHTADANLHISCLGTLAMKWLIPGLQTFHTAHPQVQVRISESNQPCDFRRDAVDLAIRTSSATDGVYEITPFLEQFHGPVLAPHLLHQHGAAERLLLELPRLYAQSYPQSWAEWSANANIGIDDGATPRAFEHNAYMIEAVVAGLGVAVCPWAFVMDDISRRRLAAPLGFVPTGTHYVALRPKESRNRVSAQFRDWLVEEGSRTPGPPPCKPAV